VDTQSSFVAQDVAGGSGRSKIGTALLGTPFVTTKSKPKPRKTDEGGVHVA
jgi:hypothetical protein